MWSLQNSYFFDTSFNDIFKEIKKTKNRICLITCESLLNSEFVNLFKSSFEIAKIIIVKSNPSIKFLDKNNQIEKNTCFVAVGGGSVIDVAKILYWISLNNFNGDTNSLFNTKKIYDYENDCLKNVNDMFVIPTTTGTGSEVTSFATFWDFELKKKLSFSSKLLKYKVFYNKDIVSIQPYPLLISSLFDALSHSFESVWNKKTNHLTELYSLEAISIILKVLIKIENNEELLDHDFDNLCLATHLSGSAISITETALCHSMSYPITLNYNVNHGLAVGFLLASVMKFNEQYIFNKFNHLFTSFSINNLNEFSSLIARLFKNTGGLDLVLSKIKNISDLNSIASAMINPDRSKNNIRPVDSNSINQVIGSVKDIYENI